ncbi:hypothetical protein KBD59_04990 [Candidatus Gracilibacteria bacterium]|nr:hypothetical protein [Candidatus Gracilibacteria bacterium]
MKKIPTSIIAAVALIFTVFSATFAANSGMFESAVLRSKVVMRIPIINGVKHTFCSKLNSAATKSTASKAKLFNKQINLCNKLEEYLRCTQLSDKLNQGNISREASASGNITDNKCKKNEKSRCAALKEMARTGDITRDFPELLGALTHCK